MKTLRRLTIVVGIALFLVLAYPLRSGRSLRDATADEVSQQVPYALHILAVRHPFKVGLVRSVLNSDGAVDRLAQDYVRNNMNRQDISVFQCYLAYYVIILDKDEVRKAIADGLERDLGLA